jgi:hypothetical protein
MFHQLQQLLISIVNQAFIRGVGCDIKQLKYYEKLEKLINKNRMAKENKKLMESILEKMK